MVEVNVMNDEMAQEVLQSGYSEAEELLKDEDRMERFLQRLEHKLKNIPIAV